MVIELVDHHSVLELLQHVYASVCGAVQHAAVPLERLVAALGLEETDNSRSALFQVTKHPVAE